MNCTNQSNKRRKPSPPNIIAFKLEAIFLPKFDNETPDTEIRRTMLAKVGSRLSKVGNSRSDESDWSTSKKKKNTEGEEGGGYLEVTLKHSGSLLLWSGRQGFYSKKSTDSIVTKVGEVMLMQHFRRCFGDVDAAGEGSAGGAGDGGGVGVGEEGSNHNNNTTTTPHWKKEYERCSEYIYKHRLTCSFEVVTSILGHHGDLPNRDYLILIAVADRRGGSGRGHRVGGRVGSGGGGESGGGGGTGRFYSTNELVKFAHQFRLPHNDTWIFRSPKSCEELFRVYDTMRECGMASTVMERLDRIVASSSSTTEDDDDNVGWQGSSSCAADAIDACKFSSLYPHDIFQGDILEGIVIRFVPYEKSDDDDDLRREIECLSTASKDLLRLVPPSRTLEHNNNSTTTSTTTTTSSPPKVNLDSSTDDNIQLVNLRALGALDDFEERVESVLRKYHGSSYRTIQPWSYNSSSNDDYDDDNDGETTSSTTNTAAKFINIVDVAKGILSSSAAAAAAATNKCNNNYHNTCHDYNRETLDIARLICTLDELNIAVSYNVLTEKTSSSSKEEETGRKDDSRERCICILHIHHDSSFVKYNNFLSRREDCDDDGGGMMLFRGFSIELVLSGNVDNNLRNEEKMTTEQENNNAPLLLDNDVESNHCSKKEEGDNNNSSSSSNNNNNNKPTNMMLKMKFLPYMVRTFIMRNGLSILQRSSGGGSSVMTTTTTTAVLFEEYAISQLIKWKVSNESMTKWMPLFKGWAQYCSSSLPSKSLLPPLSEKTYLHHIIEYEKLFAKGEYSQPSHPSSSEGKYSPSFHGLIVIVGPTKANLEHLSLGVSQELGCSKIVRDVNQITVKDVLLSMQRGSGGDSRGGGGGGGLICIAGIEDGFVHLRRMAKEYHEAIYIIMVEEKEDPPKEDEEEIDSIRWKKIKGMTKGWRKVKCNTLFDLPGDATKPTGVESTLEYLRTNDIAKNVMAELKASSKNKQPEDDNEMRPGLVVYFPSLPGSGKSSLCQNITSIGIMNDNRKLILMEGDEVKKRGKGKFFNVAQKEILTNLDSILILDKNVPPSSFPAVHTLCIEGNKSIALPVLPSGMKDTLVVGTNGASKSSHVYPFSLQHLAVCIARVLRRPPNTHKGKLDSAVENACMVVVKFYCFYRNMSTSALEEKLLGIGQDRGGKEIVVVTTPFFREEIPPDLPKDLKMALEDAIVLQTREDVYNCKVGKDAVVDMEKRLRSSIHGNQSYIENLTVSLEESKTAFVSELSRVIASLPDKLLDSKIILAAAEANNKPGTIKIASLDLDRKAVQFEIIAKLRKSFPEVEQYFADREEHNKNNNDENDKSQNRFITSLHCTFAHASQATQESMITTFQHVIGTKHEVKAVSLLYSDESAAIELEIPKKKNNDNNSHSSSFPAPLNTFPHVTIWCAKDHEAYESNELPEKVKRRSAKKVMFEQPVVLSGVFNFWYN